ncbi:MAG: formate dehydrogenase accessory sulfurtransferase FdhD [Myxococcales bacterium]|nr:formate dehydrogenase accessory sulfurtransferase FdhD [Myxococcales bacterium]
MDETVERECMTWENGHTELGLDHLVREEPLEIRVNGAPVAVLMRTPGEDRDLVLGFLLTENIVGGWDEVRSVRPCADAENDEGESHVMQVVLEPHVEFDLARFRRNLYASSSCGICGRASIEAVMTTAPPLRSAVRIEPRLIPALVDTMRVAQPVFDLSGAVHAAAAFDHSGACLVVREDIGRHNAVDKVIGHQATRDCSVDVLVVSGRVSFEIVQKALAARIPWVVGVSAPSALAVSMAQECGMGLVGFARGFRMVVYSGYNGLMESLRE